MNPTHFSIAARVAKPLITASSVLLGRAALCARGRRPARSPSAPRASLGASTRCPARPRHRPRAPQPGPPVPPAPSTPVTLIVLTCCPGPSAAHGHRSQAHWSRSQATPQPHKPHIQPSQRSSLSPHPISHAIPSQLFQTLNSDRWNCNVFRLC